jgi:hypothetical protein
MTPAAIDAWHRFVKEKRDQDLANLLADDVVFHSPVVHTPQRGKPITTLYLTAASNVFFNESFTYVRQAVADRHAFLEFATEIEGIHVNGVDIIAWNAEGRINEFKVLIRPLKAINTIHQLMGQMLERMKSSGGSE